MVITQVKLSWDSPEAMASNMVESEAPVSTNSYRFKYLKCTPIGAPRSSVAPWYNNGCTLAGWSEVDLASGVPLRATNHGITSNIRLQGDVTAPDMNKNWLGNIPTCCYTRDLCADCFAALAACA